MHIINSMKFNKIWDQNFESKIEVIYGNLSQDDLGLMPQHITHISTKIDAIIHNGAHVNNILPYTALKPVNVTGTLSLLHLASISQLVPFHYVSTMAVFPLSSLVVSEYSTIDSRDMQNASGYSQTKWVLWDILYWALVKWMTLYIEL